MAFYVINTTIDKIGKWIFFFFFLFCLCNIHLDSSVIITRADPYLILMPLSGSALRGEGFVCRIGLNSDIVQKSSVTATGQQGVRKTSVT